MLSKLKEKRKALHLTQIDLASKIGVTRRSVIRWENAQTTPSMRKIELLAKTLGCEASDLMD